MLYQANVLTCRKEHMTPCERHWEPEPKRSHDLECNANSGNLRRQQAVRPASALCAQRSNDCNISPLITGKHAQWEHCKAVCPAALTLSNAVVMPLACVFHVNHSI